jgi:LPXTG-motif cell wall-anchored protein
MVDSQPIKSIVEFTPSTKDGTVDVNITFSTEGLSEGDKIVVFEKIYDVATETEIADGTQTEDLLIARHEDLNDSDQTITIHFRPTTGEIIPTYTMLGAGLVALSALIAAFLFRRKKRTISPE